MALRWPSTPCVRLSRPQNKPDYIEDGLPNIELSMTRLAKQMQRRGVCILLSDFYFSGVRSISNLEQRHRLLPFVMRDNLEVYLTQNPHQAPFLGWVGQLGRAIFWASSPTINPSLVPTQNYLQRSPLTLEYISGSFDLESFTNDILLLDRIG